MSLRALLTVGTFAFLSLAFAQTDVCFPLGTVMAGEGTEESPYVLSSPAHFVSMADHYVSLADADVSGTDACWGAAFGMADDVDLTGVTWHPIGRPSDFGRSVPFRGTFDGQNHTISGFDVQLDRGGVGLFGEVGSATLRNVTFHGANVSGKTRVGVLAARVTGGTVDRVTLTGGSTISATEEIVGGLIGRMDGGTISNVTVSSVSILADKNVGGVVGYASNPTLEDVTVQDLVVTSSGNFAGGVVGYSDANLTLRDVEVADSTTVNGGNSATGGVVGRSQGSDLLDARRITVAATVNGNNNLGGVFGNIRNPAVIDDVTFTGVVNAPNDKVSLGGLVGHVAGNGTTVEVRNVRISGQLTGGGRVGGLVGDLDGLYGDAVHVEATNVVVSAAIQAESDGAGGAIGRLRRENARATLTRILITSAATINADDAAGGIAGDFTAGPTLTLREVGVRADVTGHASSASAGGLVGAAGEGQIDGRDVYVTGNVSGDDGVSATLGTEGTNATQVSIERMHFSGSLAGTTDVVPMRGEMKASFHRSTEAGGGGTRIDSTAFADARTFASQGWSIANGWPGAPSDATWTVCTGGAPRFPWESTLGGCTPNDLSADVAVGVASRAQLRNVPFDVTVSLVDAQGEVFPAIEASTITLTATGGAEPGAFRFASGEEDAPVIATLLAGEASVTFEDVLYTGLSGDAGLDVILRATAEDGTADGYEVSHDGISVRDIRMVATAAPSLVAADGEEEAIITVRLTNVDGDPVEGVTIDLTTDVGTWWLNGRAQEGDVSLPTNGNGEVRAALRSSEPGVANVIARCPGACPVQTTVTFANRVNTLDVIPGNETAWVYPVGLPSGSERVSYRLSGTDADTWVAFERPGVDGPFRIAGLENGVTYGIQIRGEAEEPFAPSEWVTVEPRVVAPPLLPVSLAPDGDVTAERVGGQVQLTFETTIVNDQPGGLQNAWFDFDAPNVNVVDVTASLGRVIEEPVAWRWTGASWPAGESITLTITLIIAEKGE